MENFSPDLSAVRYIRETCEQINKLKEENEKLKEENEVLRVNADLYEKMEEEIQKREDAWKHDYEVAELRKKKMAEANMLAGINHQVAQTMDAYLEYCAKLVEGVFNAKSYNTDRFKEISDELILTPDEIIQMVDQLQVAYSRV